MIKQTLFCHRQWIRGLGINQLPPQPQCRLIVKSPKILESGFLPNGKKERDNCVPVMAYRGATRFRPPGWGGCEPGCISPVNYNFCKGWVFREQPGHSPEGFPSIFHHLTSTTVDKEWVYWCVMLQVEETTVAQTTTHSATRQEKRVVTQEVRTQSTIVSGDNQVREASGRVDKIIKELFTQPILNISQ